MLKTYSMKVTITLDPETVAIFSAAAAKNECNIDQAVEKFLNDAPEVCDWANERGHDLSRASYV